MDSQSIYGQIQNMGNMPDFATEIKKAYEDPVMKPLVNERADLEAQYLPSVFQPFVNMGTQASDMSPAAKLAMIGGNLGRLTSRVGANQNIQNYYGNQIDNLANTRAMTWQQKLANLKDMYNIAFQKEEADRAERARQASMRAAQTAAMFPSYDQMFGGNKTNTTNTQQIPEAIQKALYYKDRVSKGLNPFTGQPINTAPTVAKSGGISPSQPIGGIYAASPNLFKNSIASAY